MQNVRASWGGVAGYTSAGVVDEIWGVRNPRTASIRSRAAAPSALKSSFPVKGEMEGGVGRRVEVGVGGGVMIK